MPFTPVLALHRVDTRRFELSGLRTGSVRDQILRSHELVMALLHEKIIGPSSPLLVLGGGVAGVTACLTASKEGVNSTLVEKRSGAFDTQLNVHTRWLDPVEYDWPHRHWGQATMHWGWGLYELPYPADSAARLALRWSTLASSKYGPHALPLPAGHGEIEAYFGSDARELSLSTTGTGVHTAPWPHARTFGAVVSCIGFSGEKTSLRSSAGTFEGTKFWSTDTLADSDLGIGASALDPKHVLVSGGGDGAQQDFLRVLTGQCGRALYLALGLDGVPGLDLRDVLLADDAGRRYHAWSASGRPPLQAYREWHDAYEQLAKAVEAHWAVSPPPPVLKDGVDATWILGGATPSYCYGLNRLLSLLVAKLHAQARGRPVQSDLAAATGSKGIIPVMLTDCVVTNVGPVRHRSCSTACQLRPHRVWVQPVPSAASPTLLGTFDLLVVRHGVDQLPLFSGGAPVPEQIVPMQSPA